MASAQPGKSKPPPGTGTDIEIDPDAPKEEEKRPEPPPLPPADPEGWGVGGKEEEGRFAPQGKTGTLKEEEEARREAEKEKGPVDLGLPGAGYIDMVVGFGEINDATNNATIPTEVTVFSFVFGAQYRAWDIWTMGLRFPYSTGTIEGPLDSNSDDFNTFAVGNFELSVSPSFQITRRLRVVPGVAMALPTASGDLFASADERGFVAQALLNQSVAASRGWEDNALFASKRFGLTPSAGVTYDKNALHLAASTKVDLIFRTGGADPDPKVSSHVGAELHDPNAAWVLGASGFYDFLEGKVSPGLRAWLSYFQEPVTKGTRDFSGAQFVVEPTVTAKFPITSSGSLGVRGGLSYLLPLGGPLGNGAYGASIGGLRIKAAILF